MTEWQDTELGMLPKTWKVSPIGDVGDVTKLAGYEYTKHFKYIEDGEIIALRALNVREGKLDLSNVKRIDKNVSDFLIRSKLFSGDLLFTYVGANIGQFALVDKNDTYHLAPNICRIRAKKNCLSYFIYSYFRTNFFRENLSNYSVGSSQPTLPMGNIRKILFPVPPINEQQAIANILSSLDDKIDLLHRQNKTLEAMAETLFRQWFENCEFNGEISQLINIQNGYAFKSNDFKDQGFNGVIKIKNISAGIIDIQRTDFIDNNVSEKTPERFKVQTGDVLIGMTGAEIGKLGIVPKNNKNLWLNQRVGLIREKHEGAKYLAYLQLKSEFGQDYIINTATGSAQPNISGTGIECCGFPVVSESEIKRYSAKIEPIYQKLIFNLGQIETLEKLRDNLLPKLMSGEVRVSYE